MKIKSLLLALVLIMFTTTAYADTWFRANGGGSFGNADANLIIFGQERDLDLDTDTGYTLGGALGFSPAGSGFFGEVESGYTKVDVQAPLSLDLCGGECQRTLDLNVDASASFVHAFFNLGYEHEIMDNLSGAVYVGGGPTWSEIQADVAVAGSPFPNLRFDGDTSDVAFGWQAGGTVFYELLAGLDIFGTAAYRDFGTHRILGVEHEYSDVAVQAGVRISLP